MRLSARIIAAMLIGSALSAFQFNLDAQSRGGSRSSSTPRSSGSTYSRPSGSNDRKVTKPSAPAVKPDNKPKPDMSPADRNPSRPSGNKPSGNKPSGNRPPADPGYHKPNPGAPKPDFKPGNHNKPISVRPPQSHPRPDRIHPRDRDFMHYSKPSYHWASTPHYYGYRVRTLPVNVVRRIFGGTTYYCYDNIWYRPHDGYYIVCRPPFGTLLAANLIADFVWTAVKLSYYDKCLANQLGLVQNYPTDDASYFYQDGVFYSQSQNGKYYVIAPPAGALVEALPEDFDTVILDGKEYYRVDDTIYRMTINDGKPYFEVIGQMN